MPLGCPLTGGRNQRPIGRLPAECLDINRVATSKHRGRCLEHSQGSHLVVVGVDAVEARLLGAEQSLYQAALLCCHRQTATQSSEFRRCRHVRFVYSSRSFSGLQVPRLASAVQRKTDQQVDQLH